ncbi:MAG: cysteine--tRNA ligase [Patescibacteria group bacterium]|nr:cysteine--tRNA ligase [Patescibacteria group bacterium]MCL5224452.1 cysteine--tRNA ligase [Patescibacteria group bacterium]
MLLYNTLARKKEQFKPIKRGVVGLYTCGPTVYNYVHLGNLRTYLFEDVLQRVLEWDGYKVRRAMNITDVGHLTSDADEGDDKLEIGARREGKSPSEVAKFYASRFFADLAALNVIKPAMVLAATQTIPEQIEIIKLLGQKGFTYVSDKAIYFDTSKVPDYGKLSGQKLSEKKTGARAEIVQDADKRHPADFALWFFLKGRYRRHILHWPSPWGEGFPGWHIECSAISRKLLGQPFDIHTGGVDHIGTHHTNEIAQSESAYGKPLADYWMHGEFLTVDQGRMGKSAGNFITLADLEKRGIDPLAYRYFVLGAHYRSPLNFTWEAVEGAAQALKNTRRITALLKTSKDSGKNNRKVAASLHQSFSEAVNDDLNTPRALAVLWETVKSDSISSKTKLKLIMDFDKILGLNLKEVRKIARTPRNIVKLVQERELFRRNKQFVQSDSLRNKIKELGYSVDDTPLGPFVYKS